LRKNRHVIRILLLISLLATLLLASCVGQTTITTPIRSYSIVKTADIVDLQGVKWEYYQLRLTLQGGGTFTGDLNLSAGDEVGCYYITEQPESGGSVRFQVEAGASVIYPLGITTNTADPGNTSDRFSFTAKQVDGTSYRLIFHNNSPDINSKEIIYTEISFPANSSGEDSILVPIETN